MIVKLLILVIFLGFVCWVTDLCKTDYDRCYLEMESNGSAVFGECCGLSGGTCATEYLSEQCVSCPYLSLAQTCTEKVMNMTDFNTACERLAEAWQAFGVSLQEAIQSFSEVFGDAIKETMRKLEDLLGYLQKEEKKSQKPNGIPPVKYHKKDYLHNQSISAYRVDKKIQKNLPYQRRNY